MTNGTLRVSAESKILQPFASALKSFIAPSLGGYGRIERKPQKSAKKILQPMAYPERLEVSANITGTKCVRSGAESADNPKTKWAAAL